MSVQTFPLPFEGRENLRQSLVVSAASHAALLGAVLGYGLFHFGRSADWGNPFDSGSSTRVGTVASLPGVPLPTPLQSTPNTVANQNPGLYQSEPITPLPPEQAVEIPKFRDDVKPDEAKRINTRIQKQQLTPPANAVPFGENGHPAMSYSQSATSSGDIGFNFGKGDFGNRYGWYVDAVRSRVSGNWLLSTISPNLTSAPRVCVTFDIQRDGGITDVKTAQSSGNSDVDRSALRAVIASNPVGPLPSDYSGSQEPVTCCFDFHR